MSSLGTSCPPSHLNGIRIISFIWYICIPISIQLTHSFWEAGDSLLDNLYVVRHIGFLFLFSLLLLFLQLAIVNWQLKERGLRALEIFAQKSRIQSPTSVRRVAEILNENRYSKSRSLGEAQHVCFCSARRGSWFALEFVPRHAKDLLMKGAKKSLIKLSPIEWWMTTAKIRVVQLNDITRHMWISRFNRIERECLKDLRFLAEAKTASQWQ